MKPTKPFFEMTFVEVLEKARKESPRYVPALDGKILMGRLE